MTSNAASFAVGPYAVDNALIESTCVYTNNPPCGAMRGFGAVQVCFAHEAQMDKLAEALDIDPIELRLLNALGPGDVVADRTEDHRDASRRRRDPPRSRARRSPSRKSCRATRCACPAARATRRAAKACGAASASPSGSRTSATPKASTTTRLRACGCTRTAAPRCIAPPRRWARASPNVILQVARTELGIERRRARTAYDRDGRLGRLGVGIAHDLDGVRRRARRVPGGARGAGAKRRRGGRRRADLPPSAHDAARSGDRADHRRAGARRLRVRGDARRRGGRRRARA